MTVAVDGDVVAENDDVNVNANEPVDVSEPVDCGADDDRNCCHYLKNDV